MYRAFHQVVGGQKQRKKVMEARLQESVLKEAAGASGSQEPLRARVSVDVESKQCARETVVGAFRACRQGNVTNLIRKALNQPYEEQGFLGSLPASYKEKAQELAALLSWFDAAVEVGSSEKKLTSLERFGSAIEKKASASAKPARAKKVPPPPLFVPVSAPI
jgi:hypothetical protein